MNINTQSLAVIVALTVLISCQNSGKPNGSTDNNPANQNVKDLSNEPNLENLKWAKPTGNRLTSATLLELKKRILNAYILSTHSDPEPFSAFCQQSQSGSCEANTEQSNIIKPVIGSFRNFFNEQAEWGKFDGQYSYGVVLNFREIHQLNDKFDIFTTNPSNNTNELISTYNDHITKGLDFDNRKLYLLTESGETTHITLVQPYSKGVFIELIDVKDKKNPKKLWSVDIEGELTNQHKIDNILYISTKFDIQNDQIISTGENNPESIKSRFESIDIADMLPSYEIDADSQPLIDNCLLEESNEFGYLELTNITAINLSNGAINNLCVGGTIDTISFNYNSAYFTTTKIADTGFSETVIHKIGLTASDAPEYLAAGKVSGILPEKSSQPLNISTGENDIRFITKLDNNNKLFILEEIDGSLAPVVDLRDDQFDYFSETKEELTEMYFANERAYGLWENTIDNSLKGTLYTIDLENKQTPLIAGALTIPSYTNFIQPITNELVLTAGNKSDPADGSQTQVKIELFDISGTSATAVDEIILENAKGDFKNLAHDVNQPTVNQNETERVRLAFLLFDIHNQKPYDKYIGYQMFEVNQLVSSNPQLIDKGTMKTPHGASKALIHGNSVVFDQHKGYGSGVWGRPYPTISATSQPRYVGGGGSGPGCSGVTASHIPVKLIGSAYPLTISYDGFSKITSGGDFEDNTIGLDAIEYNTDPDFTISGNSSAKLNERDFIASINSGTPIDNIKFWIYSTSEKVINFLVEGDSIYFICGGDEFNNGYQLGTRYPKQEIVVQPNSWQLVEIPFDLGNSHRRIKIAPKNTDDMITFYIDDLQFF